MDHILTTDGLCKQYKRHKAVCEVNMHIDRGDIYGFVGENGSGKTTVIRLITGLIFPNSGSFTLFGADSDSPQINQARSRIGAIVESPSIYKNMSAYDNLRTQCAICGAKEEKIRSVLQDVGLEALYDDKKQAGDFSLGMRQRLGIAMALLSEPEFLILDEPMNGLDPAGIVGIRELIVKLNRQRGITFLISSHILSELALIATKYGIISHGKLIREITAQQLQEECTKTTTICATDPQKLLQVVTGAVPNPCQTTDNGVQILGALELNPLLTAILAENIQILSIHCSQTSLEDYYLSVIGGAKQ